MGTCIDCVPFFFTNVTVTCDQLVSETGMSISQGYPALVGSVATISCPPGLALTGPNETICMANRHWEPHPESIMCKGKLINH